jgi:hypothetical protein
MQLILALFLLLSLPAFAQDASLRYAQMPDLATAQTLSAQAWAAVQCSTANCDVQAVTKYVWPIVGLTNGKYAIVIHSGDVYQGEHLVWGNGKSFDLTASQIASLQTRVQIGVLLADILPVALVGGRITTAQSNAISAYANTHATFKANYTALTSGPIDLEGTLVWSVLGELQTAGILTASDVATITAPQVVAVVQ